jgi:hypothetical protein
MARKRNYNFRKEGPELKTSIKTGKPPGTLTFTGEQKTKLSLLLFNIKKTVFQNIPQKPLVSFPRSYS